jgi:hypothetical protein
VDAHGYGKRFIVRADEILTAFVELQRAIRCQSAIGLARVSSISSIAPENQFGNASERDRSNNCYTANPIPSGWAKRQESDPISEGSNSAKNEKRPCEDAVNAAATGSVDQTHYTHERERRCPQNRFQGSWCPKAEREGKPWYTPKNARTWPPAQ